MEKRHELIGKVVSNASDKTITVLVETHKRDSKYGKRVKYSKKYAAHDPKKRSSRWRYCSYTRD